MKKFIAAGAAGAFAALAGTLTLRALAFRPEQEERPLPDRAEIDPQKVADDLAAEIIFHRLFPAPFAVLPCRGST